MEPYNPDQLYDWGVETLGAYAFADSEGISPLQPPDLANPLRITGEYHADITHDRVNDTIKGIAGTAMYQFNAAGGGGSAVKVGDKADEAFVAATFRNSGDVAAYCNSESSKRSSVLVISGTDAVTAKLGQNIIVDNATPGIITLPTPVAADIGQYIKITLGVTVTTDLIVNGGAAGSLKGGVIVLCAGDIHANAKGGNSASTAQYLHSGVVGSSEGAGTWLEAVGNLQSLLRVNI